MIDGEGRCILLTGEAGIGKTSLVKNFSARKRRYARLILEPVTPCLRRRPLAPLYDILFANAGDIPKNIATINDRVGLFTGFLHQLENQKRRPLL
mgnify:CR=1 FL=1